MVVCSTDFLERVRFFFLGGSAVEALVGIAEAMLPIGIEAFGMESRGSGPPPVIE